MNGAKVENEADFVNPIWKRTIASQMADAKKQQMRVDFDVKTKTGADAIFRANGSVISFAGFLAAYEDIVEEKADSEEVDRRLPAMSVGEKIEDTTEAAQGQ